MTNSSHRKWRHKFRDAFRGLGAAGLFSGPIGRNSFSVHLLIATLVLVAAALLEVSRTDWLVLVLCITMVLVAEMFNTAIERLAKAISSEEHPQIGAALDIAAGAVLLAAFGACVVGFLVFYPYLAEHFAASAS